MGKVFNIIRNYFCYCGIEKEEYNQLKKAAYISNYQIWKILHFLMAGAFGFLMIGALRSNMLQDNFFIYLSFFAYSVLAIVFFFKLQKDSIIAQFIIYLSISVLFLYGCTLSIHRPDIPAVSFIAFLLVTPMFMIDKPYFMAIELCAASAVFLLWTSGVKPANVWQIDCANVVPFTVIGIFLNVIANSIRIKEFVLARKINFQKDTDELTGLKNKGKLTREINKFLSNPATSQGILFMLDIDRFKSINDTYGHDTGDTVIREMGLFLADQFTKDEIVGRFGGDEFIIFIRNESDPDFAARVAEQVVRGAAEHVRVPESGQGVSVSVGIALYHGEEKNYSEIFKKADTAMYISKADPAKRFHISED